MVYKNDSCKCGERFGLVVRNVGKFINKYVCPGCLQQEIARLQRKITKLRKSLVIKVQNKGDIHANAIDTKALGEQK